MFLLSKVVSIGQGVPGKLRLESPSRSAPRRPEYRPRSPLRTPPRSPSPRGAARLGPPATESAWRPLAPSAAPAAALGHFPSPSPRASPSPSCVPDFARLDAKERGTRCGRLGSFRPRRLSPRDVGLVLSPEDGHRRRVRLCVSAPLSRLRLRLRQRRGERRLRRRRRRLEPRVRLDGGFRESCGERFLGVRARPSRGSSRSGSPGTRTLAAPPPPPPPPPRASPYTRHVPPDERERSRVRRAHRVGVRERAPRERNLFGGGGGGGALASNPRTRRRARRRRRPARSRSRSRASSAFLRASCARSSSPPRRARGGFLFPLVVAAPIASRSRSISSSACILARRCSSAAARASSASFRAASAELDALTTPAHLHLHLAHRLVRLVRAATFRLHERDGGVQLGAPLRARAVWSRSARNRFSWGDADREANPSRLAGAPARDPNPRRRRARERGRAPNDTRVVAIRPRVRGGAPRRPLSL